MELQHFNAKIFVDGAVDNELAPFIEVFHEWIRKSTVPELLVDVADYRHVPAGPGVILIGLEGNYSMDYTRGRLGLRYNRKAVLGGSNMDRLRQAVAAVARAGILLEEHFAQRGGLRFNRRELELLVNDRMLAANTSETFDTHLPEIEAFLRDVLGHEHFTQEHDTDPRQRFRVHVRFSQPIDFAALSACPS